MTQSLKEILGSKGMHSSIKKCSLVLLWEDAVEGEVKKNTEALKMQDRTLYVLVSGSVWAQELTFLKKDIIKKLNQAAGYEAVRDIRFKVGGSLGKE